MWVVSKRKSNQRKPVAKVFEENKIEEMNVSIPTLELEEEKEEFHFEENLLKDFIDEN